jgi:hypothetical protein
VCDVCGVCDECARAVLQVLLEAVNKSHRRAGDLRHNGAKCVRRVCELRLVMCALRSHIVLDDVRLVRFATAQVRCCGVLYARVTLRVVGGSRQQESEVGTTFSWLQGTVPMIVRV